MKYVDLIKNRPKYKLFIILLLISSIPFINSFKNNQIKNNKSQISKPNVKEKFDYSLIKIEKHFLRNESKELCKESIYAANLISKNINELNKVEPYYGWLEMHSLLKAIPNQLCQNRN